MEIRSEILSASQYADLCRSAGWNVPPLSQVQRALEGSLCVYSVWEDGGLVGMVRVCGDGAMCFVLRELVVIPEYRCRGIGTALMARVCEYVDSRLDPGMKACLELQSAVGRESFYVRMGFQRRPSETQGAGMFLMWEKK